MEKCGIERQVTGDNIIWRMSFICWIIKATDIRSEYVIFIVFPWQKCLHESAPVSRNAYTACLVIQGVTGGTDQTSGECSLGQTIPI